ncbi:hypothetical protein MMC16_002708 [Acarospora aff. strigata]|nr:hypothetical protein [Acarospora aff. strigata]
MPDVKRSVKLVTEQKPIDKPSGVEGFPLRRWNIQIFLLNEHGEELTATIFDKATYKLHPSFEKRQVQTVKRAPFKIEEEGWGEFDMEIVLTAVEKGGEYTIAHDLNFAAARYEAKHIIVGLLAHFHGHRPKSARADASVGDMQTFKNPKPALLAILKESGPVPGDENGLKSKRGGAHGDDSTKKKKRADKGIDMDKLAENLQKLGEDDLLQVVQMVHDNKTAETYTKNDVEQGEFHVDLYTLPDSLVRMLWDFSSEKVGAS